MFRFDADNTYPRVSRLEGTGDACRHSPAADLQVDCARMRTRLQNLQPHRSLAGDDLQIIEGRDEDSAYTLGKLPGHLKGIVEGLPLQNDFPAMAQHLSALPYFQFLRCMRHEDGGLHAQNLAGPGNTLRVISR